MSRSRGVSLLIVVVVAAVAAVILVGSGFVAALPSFVGGTPAVAGISVAQAAAAPLAPPRENSGYDVSFPQCASYLPPVTHGFAIVGVHGGRPFKDQPCLAEQAWWAQQHDAFAVYMNTEFTADMDPVSGGRAMADDAAARMDALYLPAQTPVWLDVETDNYWQGTREQHGQLIGAIAGRLAELGHPVGVYSAPRLWRTITGGVDPGMPIWLAIGKSTREQAERACATSGFGGRKPSMVQWIQTTGDGVPLDHDLICPDVEPAGLLMPGASAS